jgi:hypothetical protein
VISAMLVYHLETVPGNDVGMQIDLQAYILSIQMARTN